MSEQDNISADDLERLENNYEALLFKLGAYEAANQETHPGQMVSRLVDGEPPLRVWREHRKLSREGLSDASGVDASDIARVEDSSADLGLRRMVDLARALRIDAEDLLPWRETTDAA